MLAVAVLDDVDLVPGFHGVAVGDAPGPAGTPLVLPWPEVAQAVAGRDPDSPEARHLLATWVTDRAALAALPDDALPPRARAVALPHDHALHPGAAWVRLRVPGDALHVGLGLLGLRDDPDRAEVCAPALLAATGVDADRLGAGAADHLVHMGTCAASGVAPPRWRATRPTAASPGRSS